MKHILILLFTFSFFSLFSQEEGLYNIPSGMRNTGSLGPEDALLMNSIEDAVLKDEYRLLRLPDSVDNSQHPWFRPIFSQEVYPNCMQSTSIAYNFTYEINRLRDLPADTSINQYTTHFAWNFFNGGNGWYGVNYLFTMDVLKHHGNPTVEEYGGMYTGGGERWMSGYNEWYNAMNNRINGARKIYVGDEYGLLVLKHWLYHHLDSSESGGLASFIACSPYSLKRLPDGTPNAGKFTVTEFCPEASHGMTIVGYNDSIRYDYNEDGLYTNDIDLNGDGVINVRDWEIGGVKFCNSYGNNWADSGFCYMMYKTLADDFSEGGIWTNTVHIIDAKESHHTPLTCKVSLNHNYRERIRVRAGISSDLQSAKPDYIHDYTIFNYQGGWHYMQGNDTTPEHKNIEFALDLTPLLAHATPGQPAKFFLVVDEQDPENYGHGQVNSFSLMDYTGPIVTEIPCEDENVPLADNGQTLLSIIYQPEYDALEIITEELPLYTPGQPMEVQLEAEGGETPYTWSLNRNFDVNMHVGDFPETGDSLIIANSFSDSLAVIPLEFSFPFYGKTYDTLMVSALGYISVDENMFFWSYLVDMAYFLKSSRVIAPFLCLEMMVNEYHDHGVWYEGDEESATFRWKAGYVEDLEHSDFNFAVKLFPDGRIEYYFGNMQVYDPLTWISGVADGDLLNYSIPELPQPDDIADGTQIDFVAHSVPDELSLNENGLLSLMENSAGMNKDIRVMVRDNSLLSSYKTYQLTEGLEFSLHAGENNDRLLHNSVIQYLDLEVRNRGGETLQALEFTLQSTSPDLEIIDNFEIPDAILPGESVLIESAFAVITNTYVKDGQQFIMQLEAEQPGTKFQRDYIFTIAAATLQMEGYAVMNESGILKPGETAELAISLANSGRLNSVNTHALLIPDDASVVVNDQEAIPLGNLSPASTSAVEFSITANAGLDYGSPAGFSLQVMDELGLQEEMHFSIRIGKLPVCVVDMDPGNNSGPQIYDWLQGMEVEAEYTQSFPLDLSPYQSVILCLGKMFSNHEISDMQNNLLEEYLADGGKLYMEGRVVWEQDPRPSVLDRFMFDIVSSPGLYEILDGVDGTFTEGLSYSNDDIQPFSYFYMVPQEPAFSILTGREYPECAAVAYDAGGYKTIGTMFELGALISSDTCQVETYIRHVLDFFGVVENSLGLDEVFPGTTAEQVLQNFPNPFSHETIIPLELKEKAFVSAQVYDMQGRIISELIPPGEYPEGKYDLRWDGNYAGGNPAPGGIYLCRILIDDQAYSGKMLLTR